MIISARVAPKRDTMKNWAEHGDFVPLRGEIVIYMDKYTFIDEETGWRVPIPGIKIGDGKTRVADLPFSGPVRYDELEGLPSIEGHPLVGNMTLAELGIPSIQYDEEKQTITETVAGETSDIVSVETIKSGLGAFTWGALKGE